MQTLETEITIDASLQTVWSILDDLARYPDWNALIPEVRGRTTVGQVLEGKLVTPNTPTRQLGPTLTRIVPARELRWMTIVPGDQGFSAEHYFLLTPTKDGGTHLIHNENFDGPGMTAKWPGIDTNSRLAYNQMNADLKARAEAMKAASVRLHPAVEAARRVDRARPVAQRSTLRCLCAEDEVEVTLDAPVTHNHLCGCSRCWKPGGALLAMTAVVPAGALAVTANGDKLGVVDPSQSIQRHACAQCGTHMFGRVSDKDHHFYGLDFVHPELAGDTPPPEFAGFVSSVVEAGASPSEMEAVRTALAEAGIPAYDAFSPEIMDVIAWHKVKLAAQPG